MNSYHNTCVYNNYCLHVCILFNWYCTSFFSIAIIILFMWIILITKQALRSSVLLILTTFSPHLLFMYPISNSSHAMTSLYSCFLISFFSLSHIHTLSVLIWRRVKVLSFFLPIFATAFNSTLSITGGANWVSANWPDWPGGSNEEPLYACTTACLCSDGSIVNANHSNRFCWISCHDYRFLCRYFVKIWKKCATSTHIRTRIALLATPKMHMHKWQYST